MNKVFCAFLGLGLCAFVSAAASADQGGDPTITLENGKVVEAVWPNGNRAQVYFNAGDTVLTPIPFRVTENLCTNTGVGQSFNLRLPTSVPAFIWRWVANSDANKVGKPLTVARGSFPLSQFGLLNSVSIYFDPRLVDGLPPDEITSDDVTWLPGMSDGVLKSFQVDAWNSERMVRNSQTGEMENRIVSGEIGLKMTPTGDHVADLAHTLGNAFFGLFGPNPDYLVGDVVSWDLRVHDQSCQISFKPDISAFFKDVNQSIDKVDRDWTPYVWNEDAPLMKVFNRYFFEEEVKYADE